MCLSYRPSGCISMTIHRSDSCKEIVHRLRICLTLSPISAQYTLEFSFELRCSTLKCPAHTKRSNSHLIPWCFTKSASFHMGWIWMLPRFNDFFLSFSRVFSSLPCEQLSISETVITIWSLPIITAAETTMCFLFEKQVRHSGYFTALWDQSNLSLHFARQPCSLANFFYAF